MLVSIVQKVYLLPLVLLKLYLDRDLRYLYRYLNVQA